MIRATMGRRKIPAKERRSEPLRLYLTPEQVRELKAAARDAGKDWRDFARDRILAATGAA